eukprot:3568517-Karenia_brevis.AAC.1
MEMEVEMETEIWVATNSGFRPAASLLGSGDNGDRCSKPKPGLPLAFGRSYWAEVQVRMLMEVEMETKSWVVTLGGNRRAVSLVGARDTGGG